jgi:hypothetical protein
MENVFGNAVVVEKLERYLDAAKKLPMGHVAIAMVGHPDLVAVDALGDNTLQTQQREAIVKLLEMMDKLIENSGFPPRDPALDASYHCYNMARGPYCFDFLIWLIDAEMTRIREGAPPPLKVGFWKGGDNRIKNDDVSTWIDGVFRPAIKLLGGIEDDRAVCGRQKELYVPRDIVHAVRAGERVPLFRSGKPSPFGSDYITITTREAEHYPERNSNMIAWYKLALDLQEEGERVIFVRDTRFAFAPMHFETCPAASVDLITRCALYEHARANLFVSNGPGGLAMFGTRPWMQMVPIKNMEFGVYPPSTAEFWKDSTDISPGEQWPWSADDQCLVWLPDTYENLCVAWRDLRERIDASTQRRYLRSGSL